MNLVETTNATKVTKVHPNKESFTDDIGLGYKTPVTTI
jgi:hypothetical protein